MLATPLPAVAAESAILVLGDSLSAAHGIAPAAGWVFRLRERLAHKGYSHRVVNASISGETTRGARVRLPEILARTTPAIAIVELGGNDGLRGISLDEIRGNLVAILDELAALGARVVLVEMSLPPNYGGAYLERFEAMYRQLGQRDEVTLAPFILAGVADNPDLMQGDGIHPTAAAQEIMLDNLWPTLRPLLRARDGA